MGVVDGVSAKTRLPLDGLASDEFAARAAQNDAAPPLAYRRGSPEGFLARPVAFLREGVGAVRFTSHLTVAAPAAAATRYRRRSSQQGRCGNPDVWGCDRLTGEVADV